MFNNYKLFFGPGEVAEKLSWRFAPESIRLKLASLKSKENSQVPRSKATVYYQSQATAELFSKYETQSYQAKLLAPEASLIATVKNDLTGVEAFFDGLKQQTLAPDEVVISDGGSTDGTLEKLREIANTELPFKLVLIESPDTLIAEGRNQAIEAASNEVIALSDFGCKLDKHWLERILAPFSLNPKVDLSMGWYEAKAESGIAKAFEQFLIPPLQRIDPETFLPSARSMALKKSLWKEAGGFPEYLSYAGEDSLFDYFCKFRAKEVAFVPEAIAYWSMPSSYPALFKTVYRYSLGDAEGGKLFWTHYIWAAKNLLKVGFEFVLASLLFAIGGGFFSFLGLLCLLAFSLRLVFCTLRYQPFSSEGDSLKDKALKLLAASSMFVSQALGFMAGVVKRPQVESQRLKLSKPEGYLLIEVSSGSQALIEKTKSLVESKLDENYFVGVLEPLEWRLPVDHPKLELFKSEHFNEAVWKGKYGEKLERITV